MDVDVKKRNGPLRARAGAGRVVSACHWSLLSSVRTRKITSSAVQDKSGARWNYTIGRSGREQRAVAAHWTIRSRRQTGRARARGRAGDRLAPSTAERPSRLRTPDLHTHQQGNLRLGAPRTDAAPQALVRCGAARTLFREEEAVCGHEHRAPKQAGRSVGRCRRRRLHPDRRQEPAGSAGRTALSSERLGMGGKRT